MNEEGVNNMYKVKKRSAGSIRYAEQAVLENMHVATFFDIVTRDEKLNVFGRIADQVTLTSKQNCSLTNKHLLTLSLSGEG